jgi:RND family efflux transporter MFP subunit
MIGLAALAAAGIAPRLRRQTALAAAETAALAPRRVRVGSVVATSKTADVTLPATSAPLRSTQLYAKSAGFLRRNHADVGDVVKSGQNLADIDARETDEELRLAEAQLEEALANVGIVQGTASRNGRLAEAGVVSQQQADDTRAQANTASAVVKTRRAAVERLRAVRAYQQVTAPFDGVVVRRGFDPGALVGTASTGSTPLFEVAAIDTLRVVVEVPQAYASGVAPGLVADVFLPTAPQVKERGTVVRVSSVLDATTRTRRTEIELPGGRSILPNAFVYATLAIPKTTPGLSVPSSALIVRREGTLLARVKPDEAGVTRVTLLKVEILRDQGKDLDILGPLAAGERVVLNGSDELADGSVVTVDEGKPDEH